MQSKEKVFKDPIYGYIGIPIEYITNIIDKAEFQRLRRIIQTSYSPLYSSALHNRFVHSIGVFYLGNKAAKKVHSEILKLITESKINLTEENATRLRDIYLLACLLHDVGHAPFSHTGEKFYLYRDEENTPENIIDELIRCSGGNKDFESDTKGKSHEAAPHEIMSAIVGIKTFSEFFIDDAEKVFFARCIIGCKYTNTNEDIEQIKNCYISLLNSKEIDVDRLDYLIRDAYTSGYNSVNIDYERLLDSITIVKENNIYRIAYRKTAISVLENVLYAHDAERKWIQKHPSVLYEMYIIEHIIKELNKKLNVKDDTGSKYIKSLISEKALSQDGVELNNGVKISLLCDDDLIYLAKTFCNDSLSKEFFNRDKRRHPVWKSESEYKALFKEKNADEAEETKHMIITLQSMMDEKNEIVINKEYEAVLKTEYDKAKSAWDLCEKKGTSKFNEKKSFKATYEGAKRKYELCKFLNDYADKYDIRGEYKVLSTGMFNSNFTEDGIRNTLIVFDDPSGIPIVCPLGDVCSILNAERQEGQVYYIFYYRKGNNKIEFSREFYEQLLATQL